MTAESRREGHHLTDHLPTSLLAQAERLWEDLGSVLTWSAVSLACILLASAIVGCSGRVEVESATWTGSPEMRYSALATLRRK